MTTDLRELEDLKPSPANASKTQKPLLLKSHVSLGAERERKHGFFLSLPALAESPQRPATKEFQQCS